MHHEPYAPSRQTLFCTLYVFTEYYITITLNLYVSSVGVGFGLMRGLHFAIRFTIRETFDQLFIIPALY